MQPAHSLVPLPLWILSQRFTRRPPSLCVKDKTWLPTLTSLLKPLCQIMIGQCYSPPCSPHFVISSFKNDVRFPFRVTAQLLSLCCCPWLDSVWYLIQMKMLLCWRLVTARVVLIFQTPGELVCLVDMVWPLEKKQKADGRLHCIRKPHDSW